jgi:hypothetical protein
MRYVLTLLLCLFFPLAAQSGIKKSTQQVVDNPSLKEIYTKTGSLDVPAIFQLTIGAKVEFRLPDGDGSCRGEVVNISVKENESLMVFGKISEKDKSGFIFVATTNNTVGGALFFPEKGLSYSLKYDKEKDFFSLEKKKVEVRNGALIEK